MDSCHWCESHLNAFYMELWAERIWSQKDTASKCNLTKHGSGCRIFIFVLYSDIGNARHLFIKIIKNVYHFFSLGHGRNIKEINVNNFINSVAVFYIDMALIVKYVYFCLLVLFIIVFLLNAGEIGVIIN